ncbi:hypothetical protein [Rhodococcus jostii]|uniref:hypothetical protein n=1 Tax=Rhodococcus jostii TaxID=132919 RepID=UPI0036639231
MNITYESLKTGSGHDLFTAVNKQQTDILLSRVRVLTHPGGVPPRIKRCAPCGKRYDSRR